VWVVVALAIFSGDLFSFLPLFFLFRFGVGKRRTAHPSLVNVIFILRLFRGDATAAAGARTVGFSTSLGGLTGVDVAEADPVDALEPLATLEAASVRLTSSLMLSSRSRFLVASAAVDEAWGDLS
jgi:hypothetical protein